MKKLLLALTFTALASAPLVHADKASEQDPSGKSHGKKTNIVFILADDLGYGELGCYGQEKIKTPHIDGLAAEGMRFSQHYTGAAVCAPARCVLLTGQHLAHAQIRGNRDSGNGKPFPGQFPITAEVVTLAETLKNFLQIILLNNFTDVTLLEIITCCFYRATIRMTHHHNNF